MRSAAHPGVPRLLKAAADETLRQTSAIEAILLYGSRATGTHREDSDWDIAVVTDLTRDEGFKAAGPLYTDEIAEQHWTEVACTTRGKIERYANTAGTLESRIAREAVLIAGKWKRPACAEGRELEIDAGQALTWAQVAAGNAMGAAAWLETASAERWKGDNQAGAKVQRMAEQVTKGILATFGVYESDIHDLERSADELENAYASSQWMEEERAQFVTRVRGLKARGRAALRAEEQGPEGSPLEPVDDTIERLGAAFDLMLRWLEFVVRLHREVKENVAKVATELMVSLEFTIAKTPRPGGATKLAEHLRRTQNQARTMGDEEVWKELVQRRARLET